MVFYSPATRRRQVVLQFEIEFPAFGSRSVVGVGRKGSVMEKIVDKTPEYQWRWGVLGIAYQLQDVPSIFVDGRFVFTIPGLIEKLSFVDRREFEAQMSKA